MNGFYNVIKPIGKSSSDLVIKIRGVLRRNLGRKVKVGHLGTLDPLATGVLGVAVGSATKLFDWFLSKRKIYVATCVLGKETDTLDSAGEVIREEEVKPISDRELKEVLASFVGEISQIPPNYSAKMIDGVRAYRLAAKGQTVELKPCKVTIYSAELLSRLSDTTFTFQVECSGGTYIRSLCRDIGATLGYPAYMGGLERIQNGTMKIQNAVTFDSIEKDINSGFVTLEEFGKNLQYSDFSEENRKHIENGVRQKVDLSDGLVSVGIAGKFFGIGEVKDGELRMVARDV